MPGIGNAPVLRGLQRLPLLAGHRAILCILVSLDDTLQKPKDIPLEVADDAGGAMREAVGTPGSEMDVPRPDKWLPKTSSEKPQEARSVFEGTRLSSIEALKSTKDLSTAITVWAFIRKYVAVGGVFLLVNSWTMLQIEEYLFALVLLVLGLAGLSIQMYDWKGVEGHSKATKSLKSIAAVLILFSLVFFSAVIVKRKQMKPWSILLEQSKTPPVDQQPKAEATPEAKSSEQVFTDVDPAYLVSLYKQYSTAQADQAVKTYIGKWVKVTGTVSDVTREDRSRETLISVSVSMHVKTSNKDLDSYTVGASFEDQPSMDRALVLSRKERITVLGKIRRVIEPGILLDNCRFVEGQK